MAPRNPAQTAVVASDSPSRLSSEQTLRAASALARKIQSDQSARPTPNGKANLLADADAEDPSDAVPVWLILTTKKHIVDKKRLKPGKIPLPHPYLLSSSSSTATGADAVPRICLITADPQRKYKDLLAHPAFPPAVSGNVRRVIGLEKLKAKYNSFETKRKLLGEYDVFLADDRIITHLPAALGKAFYKSSAKRPIPVSLEGRRQTVDEHGTKRQRLAEGGTKVVKSEAKPADVAAEIIKALASALVHLAPSTTTAVKVGTAAMAPPQISENVHAVTQRLVDVYVPQGWRNVRAVHIKGPDTVALPIWLAEELWTDEQDVLDEPLPIPGKKGGTKRKRGALTAEGADGGVSQIIEVPGPDGKIRRLEKPASKKSRSDQAGSTTVAAKKRKSEAVGDDVEDVEKAEKATRKEALRKQKEALRGEENGAEEVKSTASTSRPAKRVRAKAADLI